MPNAAGGRSRLDSIDLVRGSIMILMLLDHTRDFTHEGAFLFDPLDVARTTPWLYMTRWITHLCAPAFVLLAGLSIGLKRSRGTPAAELSRFVLIRGLWFVLLEVAFFRYLIWASLDPSYLAHLQVIWAIGISMIVLSALVRLPVGAVVAIGALIVVGHNALDGVRVHPWGGPGTEAPTALAKAWMLLHQGGFLPIAGSNSPVVFANYPVLPWIGMMALGFGMSQIYSWPPERRRRMLLSLSTAMLLAFLALRATNLYGNPQPWLPQSDAVKTVMAFMNVEKYPPSLLYALITLVPSLVALALLDGRQVERGLPGAIVTFGRVPFFFYVLQWPTARLAGILVTSIQGKSIAPYFLNMLQIVQLPQPPDIGGPLWVTYVCWMSGVFLLYWPCCWFAGVKARRRDWWLSYV